MPSLEAIKHAIHTKRLQCGRTLPADNNPPPERGLLSALSNTELLMAQSPRVSFQQGAY